MADIYRTCQMGDKVISLCLDLTEAETAVTLPRVIEGHLKKVKIAAWNVELSSDMAFFQLEFSDGIDVETFGGTGSVRTRSIPIPLGKKSTWNFVDPDSLEFPIYPGYRFPQMFTVSLFDSSTPAVPLTPVRAVLWLKLYMY